jgi:hypothetical protein
LEGELALMPTPEEMLIQKIEEVEVERVNARLRIAKAKREALDAESDLIEHSINKDRLIEQLRVVRISTVDYSKTKEEKDLDRLRSIMPDLLKKIK